MTKKGPKPYYRIDSYPDHFVLTAYPVVDRALVKADSVRVGKGDPQAVRDAAEKLILDTREQFVWRRNV